MKKFLIVVCVSVLFVIPAKNSTAAPIDFEGLPYTQAVSGDVVPTAGSVLTTQFMNVGVIFGQAGQSAGVAVVRDSFAPSSGLNTVAGLDAAGLIPGSAAGGSSVGDIYFNLTLPATSIAAVTDFVSFTIGDLGFDSDIFQIRAYDILGALISTQNLSGISRFPASINVAGINRVVVDFTGDFGYSLDDLNFNTPNSAVSPVPEPGTMLLLGSGLVGLVGYGRKRFKK